MNKELYDALVSFELALEREQELYKNEEAETIHTVLEAVRNALQEVIDSDTP